MIINNVRNLGTRKTYKNDLIRMIAMMEGSKIAVVSFEGLTQAIAINTGV